MSLPAMHERLYRKLAAKAVDDVLGERTRWQWPTALLDRRVDLVAVLAEQAYADPHLAPACLREDRAAAITQLKKRARRVVYSRYSILICDGVRNNDEQMRTELLRLCEDIVRRHRSVQPLRDLARNAGQPFDDVVHDIALTGWEDYEAQGITAQRIQNPATLYWQLKTTWAPREIGHAIEKLRLRVHEELDEARQDAADEHPFRRGRSGDSDDSAGVAGTPPRSRPDRPVARPTETAALRAAGRAELVAWLFELYARAALTLLDVLLLYLGYIGRPRLPALPAQATRGDAEQGTADEPGASARQAQGSRYSEYRQTAALLKRWRAERDRLVRHAQVPEQRLIGLVLDEVPDDPHQDWVRSRTAAAARKLRRQKDFVQWLYDWLERTAPPHELRRTIRDERHGTTLTLTGIYDIRRKGYLVEIALLSLPGPAAAIPPADDPPGTWSVHITLDGNRLPVREVGVGQWRLESPLDGDKMDVLACEPRWTAANLGSPTPRTGSALEEQASPPAPGAP